MQHFLARNEFLYEQYIITFSKFLTNDMAKIAALYLIPIDWIKKYQKILLKKWTKWKFNIKLKWSNENEYITLVFFQSNEKIFIKVNTMFLHILNETLPNLRISTEMMLDVKLFLHYLRKKKKKLLTKMMPLQYYDQMYHEKNLNPRTPLTTAFFSVKNLQMLNWKISEELSRLFQTNVLIPDNDEYFIYLEDLVKMQISNFDKIDDGLNLLNLQVIEHEVKDKYNGIRQKQLFNKWFIEKDRPLVLARPMLTQGRHRDTRASFTEYQINDPKSRYFQDFISKTNLNY